MSNLGIRTPTAMAVDDDHANQVPHGAAVAAGAAATASGNMDVEGAHAQPVATFIPPVSYTMPGPPTWRVKQQFASWEIDHNRFEIKRQLGKGSYGSVAEAVDHLTGRRVAIKRIPDVFDVFENAKRIFREVHILRQMSHPNIVRLDHIQQVRARWQSFNAHPLCLRTWLTLSHVPRAPY